MEESVSRISSHPGNVLFVVVPASTRAAYFYQGHGTLCVMVASSQMKYEGEVLIMEIAALSLEWRKAPMSAPGQAKD